jgi:hypothetical protein
MQRFILPWPRLAWRKLQKIVYAYWGAHRPVRRAHGWGPSASVARSVAMVVLLALAVGLSCHGSPVRAPETGAPPGGLADVGDVASPPEDRPDEPGAGPDEGPDEPGAEPDEGPDVAFGLDAVGASDERLDPWPPPATVQLGRFATSPVCAACHSNHPSAEAMRDAAGREVGPFDLWHATMMGVSARDPLWRAVVSAEIDAVPSRAGEIEAKCVRCHAPMAAFLVESPTLSAAAGLASPSVPGLALLEGAGGPHDADLAALALDGVSCAFCHAIDEPGLGARFSFSGHPTLAAEDVLFGPHPDPFAPPMVGFSGLTPVAADHVRSSALCATCHTLHTDAFAPDGTLTGDTLPEQTPYLEWRLSAFSDEPPLRPDEPGAEPDERPDGRPAACADCHLPTRSPDGTATETRLARRPPGSDFPTLEDRAPYGHHAFVGGNTLMPQIFRDHRAALAPTITEAAWEATLAATREQLRERTARLFAATPQRVDRHVRGEVLIANLAGHKLPTGYPARRAWLRIRVLDASGAVLASSGEHDDAGAILDGRGQVAPFERVGGPVEPHRTHVASPDEVLIYEPVLRDATGLPTWRLALGAGYLKDNRLLPEGWDASHPDAAEVAPVGVADPDFAGGGDRVTYALTVPEGAMPATVEVTLFFQPLGTRFVAELLAHATAEVAAFRELWEAADRRPEVVATARAAVAAF